MPASPIFLLIVCLLGTATTVQGQVADATDRWTFETFGSITRPQLVAGEEFTVPRYQFSDITRLIYRLPLQGGFSLAGGLGIGVRNLSQRSTADRYECTLGPQPADCSAITYWVDVSHLSMFVDLPVQLRYLPGRDDTGLYATIGTAVQLPFLESTESVREQRGGAEFLLAEEQVRDRVAHVLTTGIGYQNRYSADFAWYVEVTYSRSTGTVVEGHPDRDPFRIRYFQDARMQQLGITVGMNY